MGTPAYPEAALIGRARRARRLTIVEAADEAGISHQRWSQIEGGKGNRAPAETIAHMARAVGITAERLYKYQPGDRRLHEAAEVLEEIELQAAAGTEAFDSKVQEVIGRLSGEDRAVVEELLREYSETQRQNRTILEKLVMFIGRRHGGRGHGEGRDDQSAAG
ncbi:helix-turn-helix domain-containing protein [Actinomadura rugatobispora]|uniref:Helix-turn-helix domain-containing protein n=1 Tax=Actinomadura rugatobispora TaxID=1994 RepID=A0ABW0ZSB2_9ACTN|nr:hypothetical protein GCM10010200_035750 [Actinomadura rugatobispora]